MKKSVNTTAVSAAILLALSAAVWFAIPYCIKDFSSATDIGPRAFPRLICAAIAILCALQLILLATGLQKGRYAEIRLSVHIRVYLAMAMAVAAVVCAAFVNVLIAGVICALAFLVLLRVRDWRYYTAVAAAGGLLFVLMKFVMHIRF